jgi:hypothetical protein
MQPGESPLKSAATTGAATYVNPPPRTQSSGARSGLRAEQRSYTPQRCPSPQHLSSSSPWSILQSVGRPDGALDPCGTRRARASRKPFLKLAGCLVRVRVTPHAHAQGRQGTGPRSTLLTVTARGRIPVSQKITPQYRNTLCLCRTNNPEDVLARSTTNIAERRQKRQSDVKRGRIKKN